MGELADLERRLKQIERERENITSRIDSLRTEKSIVIPMKLEPRSLLGTPASESVPATPAQKIDLFLKPFRCRESVYPKLWENKAGKKGYSPACNNAFDLEN